jgi:hypothetical protein
VDLQYFLIRRLRFVRNLYDSTIGPFQERKRQIEAGQAPYVDTRNPEDGDTDPPFLEEWQEADDSVMVTGHWCLCMVQASLVAYLKSCISPAGSYWWDSTKLVASLGAKKGKNWFERYRLLFLDDLGVDWERGPVRLTDLEQLNLTRDDLIHPIDIMSFSVERDEKHARRFPTGLLARSEYRAGQDRRRQAGARDSVGNGLLRLARSHSMPISALSRSIDGWGAVASKIHLYRTYLDVPSNRLCTTRPRQRRPGN